MSDISHVHAVATVELLLEGEDHDHLAHVFLDLLDAPGAPRPYLRADKVKDGNPQPVQLARQAQVEVGKVDEHGSVRLAFGGFVYKDSEFLPDVRQMLGDLNQPDHGDFFSMNQ